RTHIFYRFPGGYGRKALLRTNSEMAEPFVPPLTRLSQAHHAGADPGAAIAGGKALDLSVQIAAAVPVTASVQTGVVELALTDFGQPGRWALKSLGLCGATGACLVVGRDASSGQAPLFVFRRDAAGMALAFWDCSKFARPDPAQCLPASRGELERLIRPGSVVS
ncbi:MAG: hypothetical protein RIS17_4, partial [Pseudomonadota bacterium]